MSVLICGSLAYDTIMVFPDRFKNHILPEKIHMLSVSFMVPEMRREFGGCAGNIAYNLKMLGGDPQIMATVGCDFFSYADRLDKLGIHRSSIKEVPDTFTGQCFLTTDLDDNQINAFHPGAMSFSHLNRVSDVPLPVRLAIVSPDGKQGMQEHCEQLAEAGIPFIFDPGQGLPMFSKAELLHMISLASFLVLNDYELEMVLNTTGLSQEALQNMAKVLIITLGGEGSKIYTDGICHDIPAAMPGEVLDPTGCGDAYRGGLLYGMSLTWDWPVTGRLASLLGAIKIASRGGQNHGISRDELAVRFKAEFGFALPAS
ncbi:carbohydrate kinase family protein [Iodobacter ciconiae]|uniref:Carbohydrate kinase family protein n=1 Tax=Iodobacter ciconiae TaxID=2496266 RepID=A0A3S8ZVI5_9NEIS|nr:carbohydrate kinase family protein [Iodobacter ciconiae]AZN37479.1 carbohydrate kinase family protein [Iodobacter ciconiae]